MLGKLTKLVPLCDILIFSKLRTPGSMIWALLKETSKKVPADTVLRSDEGDVKNDPAVTFLHH